MEKAGVRFNARVYDDVNFVHELFVINAYNFLFQKPTCVIDIGMNVALASLLFATKPFVEEIHAFEPFDATYNRGIANIKLNPALAPKIRLNKFGLGDNVDGDVILKIYDTGDSGAMSTRDIEGGTLMRVPMRDAAETLRPIIESAHARGLEVVVKIDCEGSEFPVFASLARSDIFKQIRAVMVEWHRVFEGRNQEELIAPLVASGFMVFDITPPEGNGFFYAVRAA
jgi:FkbM family methyltransferase